MSFEARLDQLEQIVEQLDRADLPLNEALELFERGVEALRAAGVELERAETEVKRLVEQADGSFQVADLRD